MVDRVIERDITVRKETWDGHFGTTRCIGILCSVLMGLLG